MRFFIRATALTLAAFVPCALYAQDSLRVLRLQPQSPATPTASVVVMFDHPVAPRLDQSVDPTRALRIVPTADARIYWRDPSTIVAEFKAAWAPGARYEVHIDPALRSASGLALAQRQPTVVAVRMPRLLGVFSDAKENQADTVAHPVAVFENDFDIAALAGRVWFVPQLYCGMTDSIALNAVGSRRITDSVVSWPVREAGGYNRDRRLDSLRRIVEFSLPRQLARGCQGELRLPQVVGEPQVNRSEFVVRAPFRIGKSVCAENVWSTDVLDEKAGRQRCKRGPVTLRFPEPVLADEVRAHVLVNDHPARLTAGGTSSVFTLLDSIQPRRTTRVTIQSTLHSVRGEPLGHDTTMVVIGNPMEPSVGYATGQVLVPQDAPSFMRVRHVNTDSVMIVIGRVPDSLRSSSLKHADSPYNDESRWGKLARDTVARMFKTPAAADSERVLEIPVSSIPVAWRDDPLLIVRAVPFGRTAWLDEDFDVKPDRAKRGRSAIIVHAISTSGYATPRFAVLRRSNIAAQVIGAPGSAEVWATSVRTARPRADAVVRLLDDSMHVFARAMTNAAGRARLQYAIPRTSNGPFHIEVANGNDRALLALPAGAPVRPMLIDDDASDGGWWYAQTSPLSDRFLHGSAFTERGIYRPGERVYLGGTVRTFTADSGYRTPASDSARWTIWFQNADWHTERVWSHVGRLSDFGTMPDSFDIPRTARLGTYAASLALRAEGGWRPAARVEFRVAEYRAPEFAVRLDADTMTALFAGDTAQLRISARYLFGLPMVGGAVKWWWSESEHSTYPNIAALRGFTIGRSDWRWSQETRDASAKTVEGNDVLAADGTFTLRMPTRALSRPGQVEVSAAISDASRQTVSSNITIPLHSANAYIGMRTRASRWVWRARDTVAAEMLVAKTDGSVRIGDQITVVAQRYQWIHDRIVRDTVWHATLTSGAEPVTARFVPRVGGSYELIASVVDEKGRRAVTGLDVWVTGGNETWAQRDPRLITLRVDKTRYAPGDQVSVVVESPAAQRAWVTLRHEGLLHEQFVDLHAGVNEVRVPVPVSAAPQAEIRVMALRPYGSRGDDSSGIYYRAGSSWITVDTTLRALHVALAPDRERYRPGDSVHVTLNVSDVAAKKGRRAAASVWAVDQGVLSLTDYQQPALLSMLMRGSGDYAWAYSTLIAWMMSAPPAVGPAYFTIGGESMYGSVAGSSAVRLRGASSSLHEVVTAQGVEANTIRTIFATTPFFSGTVRTDANGRAIVVFKLPDNVTTFRVYAAAVGDDVYAGSGDTSIVSTRPLVVRPALPRIVRIGDTLFAGAVITQEATSRTPVSLDIATRNVRVSGRGTLNDTLDGQRARELRYQMSVTGGDSVMFAFRATASGSSPENDAVEIKLPVSPPGRARAHVVTGMVDRTETVLLPLSEGTDTLRSRVNLQLGLSALPLVREYSNALRIYPYYCTEQVSSAGRALIARLALQRALGDTMPMKQRDRTQLETGVSVLLGRQRDDGSFGYWSKSSWTTAWLTTYAMEFLMGARDVGIAVPASSLERAKAFLATTFPIKLRTVGDPFQAWRDSVEWPHNATAVAGMLRRVGVPDTTLEADLWKMREELGFEDRLSLAAVFFARADSAKSRELLDDAWRSARLEGRRVTLDDSVVPRRWLFRSTLRPIALLLATTARQQPKHPMLGGLFESLVQMGRSEQSRWWNTIDQAALADALTAATGALDLPRARTVAVSGPRGPIATINVEPRHVDSLPLSVASLSVREKDGTALQLNLASSSTAPTYYAMTLFETPLARPVRADDAGIGVERWYESYDGGKPITEVREGELVRVRLRITAPADREFVVIDDALPAGLEAVDLSLRTSASLPPFEGAPRLRGDMNEGPPGQRWLYGSWDSGWWTPWEHKEIRDDRVLYFARQLWKGSYQASYVARATTAGTFVRPPAQAEEMYNPAVHGRSDGGTFTVTRAPR